MRARNYRKAKGQSYTRKKYMRGSPSPKITKFTMGDPTGSFEYQALLIARKEAQIQHNALEA
ncbi:MAG: 50S ribosomal protein L16, partial [Candidatus Hermodarchaeia archaeon]